jgi:hypothetical protein
VNSSITSGKAASWFVRPVALVVLVVSSGCANSLFDRFGDVVDGEGPSFQRISKRHNDKGLTYFEKGKLAKAETHFVKAINSNPRSAAAHNNLGNMHLSRHELYQAAWEFQRASELAPNQPEPLINLGLVLEEAGRWDEASDYYRQALELDPNHPLAAGNLARSLIKSEADPAEIATLLRHVIFIDSRPEWVVWAEEQLATKYDRIMGLGMGQSPPSATDPNLPYGLPGNGVPQGNGGPPGYPNYPPPEPVTATPWSRGYTPPPDANAPREPMLLESTPLPHDLPKANQP